MSKTAPFGAGKCPNCGEYEAHFVPPSLGDPGFFICQTEEEITEVFRKHKEEKAKYYWRPNHE